MTGNASDALLLIGDTTIDDLLSLAQKRLPTERLRVLALAALVYAADQGEVPDSYVLDPVRSALTAAKAPDPTAH
jgi:hypothetical protein